MSTRRLRRRTPSAIPLGAARLDAHTLAFHKVSDRDGSGKCDIVRCESSRVMGVLFRLDKNDKRDLDRHEGLGSGYAEKQVTIIDHRDRPVDAVTYCATITDPAVKPFTWYLHHVIEGAREARLPDPYLQALMEVEAIGDPDAARSRNELSIYQKHNRGQSPL